MCLLSVVDGALGAVSDSLYVHMYIYGADFLKNIKNMKDKFSEI